jgi:hypothetical protein
MCKRSGTPRKKRGQSTAPKFTGSKTKLLLLSCDMAAISIPQSSLSNYQELKNRSSLLGM